MNILTFDIEEWFHILDNDSTKSEKNGIIFLLEFIRIWMLFLKFWRNQTKC